jgi:hypothetical protein
MYIDVVEDYMEAMFKLMLITSSVQCESGFTGKVKANLKRCICSVCKSRIYVGV